MPPLPRYTAQIGPPRDSGLARANNLEALTRTGGEITAQALTGLGNSIQNFSEYGARIVDKKLEAEANLQFAKVTQNAKDFAQTQADEYDKIDITSDDQQRKLAQDNSIKFDTFLNGQIASVSPRAIEKLNLWKAQYLPEYARNIKQLGAAKWNDYQKGERLKDIQTAVNNGDIDAALSVVDEMDRGELIKHTEAVKLKESLKGQWETIKEERNQKERKAIELQIYTEAVSFGQTGGWTSENKKRGLEYINKSPLLDEFQKNTLHGHLNNRYSGEMAADEKNKYNKQLGITKNVVKSITDGAFTPDDMAALVSQDSELDKKWNGDDKGNVGLMDKFYDPPPTENNAEGLKAVNDIISNVSNNKITTMDAYYAILEARYEDGSITDDTFKWAVSKIENPYPKHITEKVDAVMAEKRTQITEAEPVTKYWKDAKKTEEAERVSRVIDEKTQKVKQNLYDWIDRQPDPNKIKVEDLMVQAVIQKSMVRNKVKTYADYQIGEEIWIKDKYYQVVGFDEDGMPLVEAQPVNAR